MSKEKLNSILENNYEVNFGYYFKEGLEVYKKNIGGFTGITFVILLIYAASGLLSMIPFLGFIVSIATSIGIYLVLASFPLVIQKVRNNEAYEFRDFFAVFNSPSMGPVIALNLISGVMIMLGFLFCVLPGIYLSIAYTFGLYILLFFKIDFWESLEYSRKIVSKKWFSFFGLFILLGLLNLAGMIVLGIGLFITFPWTMCILYIAFEDIFKPGLDSFENKIDTFGIEQKDINTEADEKYL